MALDYFVNEQVDIAVVEVGLGGLLDSTNVVKPLLTGITTIGKDHTEILGETIAEIAYQKKRVLLKKKVPVVTGNICADALAVIEKVAQEKQSPIFRFGKEYQVEYLHPDTQWGKYLISMEKWAKLTKKLKFPCWGRHQVEKRGGSYSII